MRFLAQTTEGVYKADPLDGIHPDAINRYYGVAGAPQTRRHNQTGAGHADSDDSEEEEEEEERQDLDAELENRIGEDQAENIRHAPIKVARHQSPFESPEQEQIFFALLQVRLVADKDDLPEDYGIRPDEWDNEPHYPEVEVIRPGTRGKELPIILPREDWYPRAIVWAQALDFMSRVVAELDEEEEA